MRSLFRKGTPLESELRAARAEAPKSLVDSIVATVRPRSAARPARLRLAFAGALTLALVVVAGATGTLSYAATAVEHVASAVHVTSQAPSQAPAPATAQISAQNVACTQYAQKPFVGDVDPDHGSVGDTVWLIGGRFGQPNPVTSVVFAGGASAPFTIVDRRHIRTTVPSGAQTGGITVSNCAGSATSPKFTVVQPPCKVPHVVGDPLRNAENAIKHAGCKVGFETLHPYPKPRNETYYVTRQKPHAGKKVPRGSYVDLTARAR